MHWETHVHGFLSFQKKRKSCLLIINFPVIEGAWKKPNMSKTLNHCSKLRHVTFELVMNDLRGVDIYLLYLFIPIHFADKKKHITLK